MSDDKMGPDTARRRTEDWLAYIDAEVRAVCGKNGWRHQIRRKWSARETPVSSSGIDDYEWKLIPSAAVVPREAVPSDFDEGTYFVLGFDSSTGKFVLQHDTHHWGVFGDHWLTCTFTEIHFFGAWLNEERLAALSARPDKASRVAILESIEQERGDIGLHGIPPPGLLQRFLSDLTTRFKPNDFSVT